MTEELSEQAGKMAGGLREACEVEPCDGAGDASCADAGIKEMPVLTKGMVVTCWSLLRQQMQSRQTELEAQNERLRSAHEDEEKSGTPPEPHAADGLAPHGPDAESLRRMLAAVTQERDRLLAVVSNISDEIWFADQHGNFALVNPAGLREFDLDGRDPVEVAKLAAGLEIFRSDGSPRPVAEAPPLRALAGEVVCNEDEIVRTPVSGELRYRQVSSSPVRDAIGEIIGSVSVVRDISRQRRGEEMLNFKNAVFDSSITANSITNPEGIITDANDAFLRMWGFSHKAEVVGHPIPYFFIAPDQAVAVLAALNETGQWEGEFAAKRKDGSMFTAYAMATVVRNGRGKLIGYQSVITDITVQNHAKQTLREWNQTLEHRVAERTTELQQSEARFRHLAETTFEGIAISVDGILVDGNTQLGTLHGYGLSEMIGRPVTDFVAPESSNLVAKSVRDSREITFECVALRKDGSKFPLEVHARTGVWHGNYSRIAALRDLTETKRVATTMLAQQIELEQAKRLALISEVSAGIVHQIGQPLCAMGVNLAVVGARINACGTKHCGTAEIIKEIEADAQTVRDVMAHMRQLIQNIRSSRLPMDLNSLVEGVLNPLRLEVANRQILLQEHLAESLPPVLANAVQLKQVILNLVGNAFDACADCPPDRRTVTVTTQAVAGPAVELSVRDAGSGVSPAIMDRLFEPFLSTKTAGLGIGLRISRTIIEAHGGSIHAGNNNDGCGATFRVILPAHPGPAEAAE